MPIHLNRFRNFIESATDARVAIEADGNSVKLQKNGFLQRVVQFFADRRGLSKVNQDTGNAFYNALRNEYGDSIATQALIGLKGYQVKQGRLDFQGKYILTPQTIKLGIQAASALQQRVSTKPSVLNLGWRKPNPDFDIAKAESIFNEPKISQNWKNAQKHLLHSRSDDLKLLIQYRKYVVDSIVQEIAESTPGFTSQSVGSTALTSDYDITFNPVNTEGAPDTIPNSAVRAFNARFRDIFSQESGVVFDTNVYAHNYETGQVFLGRQNVLDKALKEDQHVAALLKLRKGLTADEWLNLQESSIAKIASQGIGEIERQQLVKRFEEADAIYVLGITHTLSELKKNSHLEMIHVPTQELSADAQEILKGLEGLPAYEEVLIQFTAPIVLQKLEASNPDAVLQVRNRLYERGLDELNAINKQLLDNPHSKELHAAQQHQISLCLFYAAEAYHTEGAITHVVEAMQAKKEVQLDSNQLAFSILEQIGDAQLHAHSSGPIADARWISQASKYLGRVFDAIARLDSSNQSASVRQFGAQLQTILFGPQNPYRNIFSAGEMVLLLNLLGQSVKRNAIDIKDDKMAQQVSSILQKADAKIFQPRVKQEIEAALRAFHQTRESQPSYSPYEIQDGLYAKEAEAGLAELFQTDKTQQSSFLSRKDALTTRVQEEVINAYVPVELGDLRRYFQALPNTQLFGGADSKI